MHYRIFLSLPMMSAALLLPASADAAPAKGQPQAPLWACAGDFEKRLDREEASHGIRVYRERFFARPDGAVRRAVFVFPVAFRIMRDHLRSQTATRFGEAAFSEHAALDLGQEVGGQDVGGSNGSAASAGKPAAAGAYQPGDQIAALAEAGISLKSAAAIRLATKPYNGVPSKNGWSELSMVVLDGSAIVGIDSTLVVLWRADSHEEWSTGASGRLLDFGKHRVSDTFVTSSEFALMERLSKLYNTPFGLFPLADAGPLQKDVAAWQGARDWLQRYREKPDTKLQAAVPGRC
jgi:hypothetical protein